MLRRLTLLLFFLAPVLALGAVPVDRGELAGAKFAIARPAQWNHRVLLLAHGYRPEDRPLVADLFPDHAAYRALIDEGWIVAKTSYRRNGLILADAIADLDALHDHIAQTFGPIERTVLEGESMGGMIVALMAERDRGPYAGAIAIGAALQIKEAGHSPALSLVPTIPLLFLTNQSELSGPRTYVGATAPRTDANLRPALLRVSRDGHVNVNQAERLVALRALNTWIDTRRESLPRPAADEPFADVTVIPQPVPSLVQLHANGQGFDARVSEVSEVYGNVFIDAQPADFATVSIAPGEAFDLIAHGKTYRVIYGRDFNDVPKGAWVTFPNADGFFLLSRNYADAAGTARLALGDTVSIKRL